MNQTETGSACGRRLERKTLAGTIKAGALQDAIFNSEHFSSIATDDKGVIQIFNVGAERMLGYTAADVVDQITPADISDAGELVSRAAALSAELDTVIAPGFEALVFKATRGIEDIYELTYVRKDGSRFPAIVSVTALRNVNDLIIGYLLIGTDNTARKQLRAAQLAERELFERTLRGKNIELEHASRMKSEFLATMSHELRTPLNAIIGFSDALKDGLMGPMSETHLEYIGDIFTSGQHLLALINDILDLSKVEAGMMTLEFEPVELESLLSNSLSIVREKAAAQRIQLDLKVEGELGFSELDTRKTKQIVYNLLSNAVKFSEHGGHVTLSARRVLREDVGSFSGSWAVHGFPLPPGHFTEFLEICVCDSGLGISVADMGRLFQPFSQIDSGLARKFEGTGLGLAMVKQLAELHGGTTSVSSRAGEGAKFAVWLPLRTPPTAVVGLPAAIAIATAPNPQPGQRTALIVEDDDRAADLVRLLLEAEGFDVVRASSGEEGLRLAVQQPLSLITLDVQLPGIDGWDFLLRIREDAVLARVPVVVISGMVAGNMALAGGASAVLQKPISRTQLQASLATLGLHSTKSQTLTVLVVDDDPKAVEVIAAFLPTPEYAVVRAYGGTEAIVLARRLLPDLILLDLMMPGVNGFDVVEALQRDAATASLPILVVTAKQITEADRAKLNYRTDSPIEIVEKAGFNRIGFISEVRRALART